jgi:predicted transcriptional regulator
LGRVKKIDEGANALKLVSMWLGMNDRWLYASEIRKEAKHMGFDQRTVSRHLNRLVKEGILEPPVVEGPRTRKFRPTKKYWDDNFQWIPISPKANDAEHLVLSGFVSEITNKFVEISRHVIKDATQKSNIGALSKTNRNKLDAKIARLISDMRLDIIRIAHGYANRDAGQEATYELLRNSVLKIISDYLDLWGFVMTTKGASGEFNTRMENVQKLLKQIR